MTENVTTADTKMNAEERLNEAEHLVRMSMYYATGVGLVPIPVVDLVGVAGVQLDLLRRLSDLYGVEFSKEIGKNVIASLIGGSVSFSVGRLLGSAVKVIPLVGHVFGAISVPATSGATTYALGKVFIEHFESGGTFSTFNAKAAKSFYDAQIKEGAAILTKFKTSGKVPSEPEAEKQ